MRTVPDRATMLGDSMSAAQGAARGDARLRARGTALPTRLVDGRLVVTLPDQPSDAVCSVLALDMQTAIPAVY